MDKIDGSCRRKSGTIRVGLNKEPLDLHMETIQVLWIIPETERETQQQHSCPRNCVLRKYRLTLCPFGWQRFWTE